MKTKVISLIMTFVICLNCFVVGVIPVSAHSQILDVRYDNCIGEYLGDGIDEMWYLPYIDSQCYHLSHETITIEYYFENTKFDKNGSVFEWGDYMTDAEAQGVKDAFVNSMKKWNNVYFYSYDDAGNIVKNKIINIVEGTAERHNLSIYPDVSDGVFAETFEEGTPTTVETVYDVDLGQNITHAHYSEWRIVLYVNEFLYGRERSSDEVYYIREGTGAHEIAHILGLYDLDVENVCRSYTTNEDHHHEVLMGYGLPLEERISDITYKDIAGVAIVRGFHTDNDHKWLYKEEISYGVHRLVCSICNGVKIVNTASLSQYTYQAYGQCNNNHNLSSGNMMAVASYGNKDYYKCKYCRYVASFDNIVQQNYTISNYSSTHHKCTNSVEGLSYSFLESHSYTHHYQKYSAGSHISYCACGDYVYQPHVVSGTAGELGSPCIYCRQLVDFGVLNSIPTDYPHTENGSYILPSGIIVLVPEDEEAYLNGTLEFRTGEIM